MISLPCFLLLQIVAICLHGATSTEGIDREQQHKLKHHENHASSYNDLFKTIDQNSNGNVSPEEIQQVCALQ